MRVLRKGANTWGEKIRISIVNEIVIGQRTRGPINYGKLRMPLSTRSGSMPPCRQGIGSVRQARALNAKKIHTSEDSTEPDGI